MKRFKPDILFIINILYVIVTGAFNLYGYFHLPEQIATQISFSGGSVNYMSKAIYLSLSFVIVAALSYFSMKTEKEKKVKYIVVDTVIVISNIAMIAIQL